MNDYELTPEQQQAAHDLADKTKAQILADAEMLEAQKAAEIQLREDRLSEYIGFASDPSTAPYTSDGIAGMALYNSIANFNTKNTGNKEYSDEEILAYCESAVVIGDVINENGGSISYYNLTPLQSDKLDILASQWYPDEVPMKPDKDFTTARLIANMDKSDLNSGNIVLTHDLIGKLLEEATHQDNTYGDLKKLIWTIYMLYSVFSGAKAVTGAIDLLQLVFHSKDIPPIFPNIFPPRALSLANNGSRAFAAGAVTFKWVTIGNTRVLVNVLTGQVVKTVIGAATYPGGPPYGSSVSNIYQASMSGGGGSNKSPSKPTVDYGGEKVEVYRGGNDLTPKPKDVKIDPETGFVRETHGISVDVDPNTVSKFGGAYEIESIPDGLKIVQRGVRKEHFEIVPSRPMTFAEYSELLGQVGIKLVD